MRTGARQGRASRSEKKRPLPRPSSPLPPFKDTRDPEPEGPNLAFTQSDLNTVAYVPSQKFRDILQRDFTTRSCDNLRTEKESGKDIRMIVGISGSLISGFLFRFVSFSTKLVFTAVASQPIVFPTTLTSDTLSANNDDRRPRCRIS